MKSSSKGKGKGKSAGGPILPDRDWEIVDEADLDDDEEVRYEAYWSNWDTPGFKEYHRRMQIFVLLYIEGASYIDEEDGRWEFVTLCVDRFILAQAAWLVLSLAPAERCSAQF